MSMLVTFTQASAEEIYQRNEWNGFIREPHLSSRLLNRQIKYAMHKLQRDIMKVVLDGLEKQMRSKCKDAWTPTFCTILLLCFCMEGVQTSAETYVISDLQRFEGNARYNQEDSFSACQNLDWYPYQQTTSLFHEIFRTHKAKDDFNPFRSISEGTLTGLNEAEDELAKSVYSTISSCKHPRCKDAGTSTKIIGPDIVQLSKNSILVTPGARVHLTDIRANNTGRLASKFLLSFFSAPT